MQSRTRIILGVDAGTTSVKTVAFDLDGRIASVSRSSVRVQRSADGRAEADMDHIWDAAASTIAAVVDEIGDAEIVALGVTGQGDGAWLVDADGRPAGPAALWLDGRAHARLDDWLADGRAAAVHEATGSPLFSGALPILVDELMEADPSLRERAATQLNCKDWLRFKLTGRRATDPSEASRTYLDTATGAYSEGLFAALGQERVRDRLPEVLDPQRIAGTVEPRVAAALGLPADLPVVVGVVDTAAAGVGLGVLDDGRGYAILGTTSLVGINHASRAGVRSESSIILATGRGTQVLESMAPMTGTPNLDWVRATLGLGDEDWVVVEKQAVAVAPGSGGVLYLPYGAPSGERAPFFAPDASASWLGMSVTTTAGQLLRSVYEGLAFGLRECTEALGLEGPLLVCGGGSDSDLLCAILADVLARDIVRQDEPEVGARGVATLAMAAVGLADDLHDASRRLRPSTTTFSPDPARVALYDDAFALFVATRDALRPHWPGLRRLRENAASTELSESPAL
ncbi:FGGY family carbohydrate kinase [Microbacterium sp. MYb66]|uniref:FGGY family carbohydrate kinase n=1 Tax=Microbacterium sp. MYb66 TaxID=1848692 RepID=UPI000D009164|nr:FGGY family carbohydrate kinase [Microbacterium sp. MYb66]PRA81228.1 carbohydrate kinase [Microbacterium sp. MYb66]